MFHSTLRVRLKSVSVLWPLGRYIALRKKLEMDSFTVTTFDLYEKVRKSDEITAKKVKERIGQKSNKSGNI